MERHRLGENLRPDDLVQCVVPADVLAEDEQLARRAEERGGVQPAGLLERALGGAEEIRQGKDDRAGDDRTVRDRVGADRDLVEGGLAADPARRRRDEVPLGDPRGIEGPREVDRHLVVGLVHRFRRSSSMPAASVRSSITAMKR